MQFLAGPDIQIQACFQISHRKKRPRMWTDSWKALHCLQSGVTKETVIHTVQLVYGQGTGEQPKCAHIKGELALGFFFLKKRTKLDQ